MYQTKPNQTHLSTPNAVENSVISSGNSNTPEDLGALIKQLATLQSLQLGTAVARVLSEQPPGIHSAQQATTSESPRTFRLPRSGQRCPYGFSRSFYYDAEKRGLLKLIRIRKRGKTRGITLVDADEVERLIAESRI